MSARRPKERSGPFGVSTRMLGVRFSVMVMVLSCTTIGKPPDRVSRPLQAAGGKMRMCGYADVQITMSNICISAKYSCLISEAKSPFISLNVTVLATKKS